MGTRRWAVMWGWGMVVLGWGCTEFEPVIEVRVPTDARPAVRSATDPPPVTGGTLAFAQRGAVLVAADPDRDRIAVVETSGPRLRATIALHPGDEPGRVVEGAPGTVYVALRGAGEVATVDLGTGAVIARRAACPEPRGLAWDGEAAVLHVACASGQLVTFPDGGETASRSVPVDGDLRDVMLTPTGLRVTRFHSAEVLDLDPDGRLVARHALPPIVQQRVTEDFESAEAHPMGPCTAWRAVGLEDGTTVVLHQRGQDDEITLGPPTRSEPAPYGGTLGSSPGCRSIVQAAVSVVGPHGAVRTSPPLVGVTVPVDLAVAAEGELWVANAGAFDPAQPLTEIIDRRNGSGEPDVLAPSPAGLASFSLSYDLLAAESVDFQCKHPSWARVSEPVVAVAADPQSTAIAFQTREPAKVVLLGDATLQTVHLGGTSVRHTGHELFHRDTGAGIACVSCHPEGGEDGRTWVFEDTGPRRTQSLQVGLAGTAPFHWDGALPDLHAILGQVMVERMGGVHQSPERLAAFEDWLFALRAPRPKMPAEEPAVARGRALFEAVGCTSCHAGPALTDNRNHDVGTGGEIQTPSLVGVGYRAPYLHDGCAPHLAALLGPGCGGPHGRSGDLSAAERLDLIQYLHSL